jgi:hypothetical protein
MPGSTIPNLGGSIITNMTFNYSQPGGSIIPDIGGSNHSQHDASRDTALPPDVRLGFALLASCKKQLGCAPRSVFAPTPCSFKLNGAFVG